MRRALRKIEQEHSMAALIHEMNEHEIEAHEYMNEDVCLGDCD